MTEIVRKWKTCPKFKSNSLYGSVFFLGGCVAFWSITQNKVAQYVNNELKVFTPAELKKAAWVLNGVLKGAGFGLWIKALLDYKKCK